MAIAFNLSDTLVKQLTEAAEFMGETLDAFVARALGEKVAEVEHAMWLRRQEPGPHAKDHG